MSSDRTQPKKNALAPAATGNEGQVTTKGNHS